jgi:hypothetical protein
VTATRLSIKSGYLIKRNEQGTWHTKYICTVPHVFMYYYDTETSDFPRGVIDLELYTYASIDDGNILTLATHDEEKLKLK